MARALPARGRRGRAGGGDHAPGDHTRGRRGGGTPAGSALPGIHRQTGARAARGPRRPHHRRRLRRSGLRHRLPQGHTGARFQRLRHRPAPPPGADQHLHAARHARRHRTAAFPRTRALRGPQARAGGTRGRRTHRAHRQAPAGGAARRSQRRGARALSHRPVVREDRLTRRAGHRGRGAGSHPLRAGELGAHLFRMDAQHQGLVREPAAVVGASHPGVVRRR